MKKAILVEDWQSVQQLNKLLDQGYTVDSADERGVYILDLSEHKSQPIKSNMTTELTLDTTGATKELKHLKEPINRTASQKEPRVRIEFNDIRDVPNVWLDGKRVDEALTHLNLDWNTHGVSMDGKRSYHVDYLEVNDNSVVEHGIGQSNIY